MKVAFGIKAHSGWAALVVLGTRSGQLQVVDRRRMELVEKDEASWAKQPYHAAERLNASEAEDLVKRGIEAARRIAVREMRTAIKRAREAGHQVAACAVLVVDPMPDWTVDEILAVHFRMHKAEGVLFRDALTRAAGSCDLRLVRVPEKQLDENAERALGASMNSLRKTVASLGKSVGPPWGKDQKDAALAAMIALQGK
jgi:ribosomal protein L16/L10AE